MIIIFRSWLFKKGQEKIFDNFTKHFKVRLFKIDLTSVKQHWNVFKRAPNAAVARYYCFSVTGLVVPLLHLANSDRGSAAIFQVAGAHLCQRGKIKNMVLHWEIRTRSEWRFSKILQIKAGSDSIFSDQDWTRTEKFYSPLISLWADEFRIRGHIWLGLTNFCPSPIWSAKIKSNPVLIRKFLKITSPIQSWIAHVKPCIYFGSGYRTARGSMYWKPYSTTSCNVTLTYKNAVGLEET